MNNNDIIYIRDMKDKIYIHFSYLKVLLLLLLFNIVKKFYLSMIILYLLFIQKMLILNSIQQKIFTLLSNYLNKIFLIL